MRAKLRKKMNKQFFLLFILGLIASCNQPDSSDASFGPNTDALLERIKGKNVRQHMLILASDEMKGREAGTDNYDNAADYVIQNFKNYGLKSMGDDGVYTQSIRFLESRLDVETAKFSVHKDNTKIDLIFRDDFIRSGGFGGINEEISAPMVFVGYGIVAPEYNHDDFAGVEVTNKILVMLSGAPPGFSTDQRAFYSSGRGKAQVAIARGAVGIITLRTPVDQKRRPWARYLPGVGSPGMRWLDDDGLPFQGHQELKGTATVSQSGAEKIFALSGHNLEQIFSFHQEGGIKSFGMDITATLSRSSIQREVNSANVIGYVEGSDPELSNEFLIYTAHLDHIGIRTGKEGDDIHNGAYDNAAGIGSILEIADSISIMNPAPRRSIIFAAVTAEEKGLQGSSYFVKNPPIPIENLVANINIDMPYLGFPVADLHAFGAEHSSLHDAVEKASDYIGMQFTPDPLPEEVRFVRSDQFSFVKEGIPAVALKAGTISSDPSIDGSKELDNFLKNHYHQSSDDLDLPFSEEGTEGFVRTALLLGLIVADEDEKPTWNKGDFFGDKFSPN